MPNLNLNATERVILNDILNMIQLTAPTMVIGRGMPTAAPMTFPSMPTVTEMVLTYPDGRKFAVQVDVRQLNTNAGRV